MDKTRGGPSVQRAPLKTAVAHWVAANGRVVCDASNLRPALVLPRRHVHCPRQWTGPKNMPVLKWSTGRVGTAKELVVELGFQVAELCFTDTYYSTRKPEGALQLDYMGVPLGRRLFRCCGGRRARRVIDLFYLCICQRMQINQDSWSATATNSGHGLMSFERNVWSTLIIDRTCDKVRT